MFLVEQRHSEFVVIDSKNPRGAAQLFIFDVLLNEVNLKLDRGR